MSAKKFDWNMCTFYIKNYGKLNVSMKMILEWKICFMPAFMNFKWSKSVKLNFEFYGKNEGKKCEKAHFYEILHNLLAYV